MKFDKELLKGSLILLIMFNLFNIINFVFQIVMARMLSIEEYGILASIFSLIYVLSIFSESIQTVVAKLSSLESEEGKIKNIFKRGLKKAVNAGIAVLILYLLLAIGLSYILGISYSLLALNGLIVLATFIIPVTRGILQGRERFAKLGISMIIEAGIKLGMAIILVYLGFSVYGAIGASIIGVAIAFIFSIYFINNIVKAREERAEIADYKGFSFPVLYIVAVIFIFFSLDIIIAKILFSDNAAGIYSIASTLGKIIFLGVQPISKAMFPIASSGKKNKGILNNSIIMIVILILAALLLFYFFPDFIIKIFSGREIAEASSILFFIGVSFSIQSITNLILLYKLAGKIRSYIYIALIIPIQILLLIIFSSSLISYSLALIVASAIFLIGALLLRQD